jgi:selenocysteine lyase/cysteine desulfurase
MEMKDYLISEMKKIPNLTLYGDVDDTSDRLCVIPFSLKNMKYNEVSKQLANHYGIATRYAKFCAHPYVYRLLGISDDEAYEAFINSEQNNTLSDFGLVRISPGLYNTLEEAKIFIDAINDLAQS